MAQTGHMAEQLAALDYHAKAKEMDAFADKAAKGSAIEAGYRRIAEGYRALANAPTRADPVDLAGDTAQTRAATREGAPQALAKAPGMRPGAQHRRR
jgi:hypothetical protein